MKRSDEYFDDIREYFYILAPFLDLEILIFSNNTHLRYFYAFAQFKKYTRNKWNQIYDSNKRIINPCDVLSRDRIISSRSKYIQP